MLKNFSVTHGFLDPAYVTPLPPPPLNIQPAVVVRGLKRQQDATLTNFVGSFFLFYLISFFSSLALNDLTGPSAEPLA